MAVNHGKMTRWAWDTKLTTLATNTTLGTATRYDTEAQTIYVPETTRTVKRAMVRVTFRDATTGGASVDVDGVRIGIKINAVAFSDLDITTTKSNTGNSFQLEYERDVTSYFVTNDPATTSFTAQVGIAVATGSASIINNITFELLLTYDYDSSAGTWCETAEFPIQGHTTTIPTAGTYVEVGTTGTCAAPVNQIRQLTGTGGAFEGVTGFTLRKRYLIVFAHDAIASTSDVTPKYRFDGGADNVRAVLEAASNRSTRYSDIIDITSLSTSAAHSFEVTSDVNARMETVSAFDVVTYEYTAPSSSTDPVFVSVRVPLENLSSVDLYTMSEPDTAANCARYTATIDVQESGPITMDQSGVVWTMGYAGTENFTALGQITRTYSVLASSKAGNLLLVHRTDHSCSAWSLRRGINRLHIDRFSQEVNDVQGGTGFAIINYRCTAGAAGAANKNRTVFAAQIMSYIESDWLWEESTPTAPAIIESNYTIVGAIAHITSLAFIGSLRFAVMAQRQAGEDSGKGWYEAGVFPNNISAGSEFSTNTDFLLATPWFRKRPNANLPGADVETTARKWRIEHAGITSSAWTWQAELFLTYHTIAYTVSGTYTIDAAAVASQTAIVDVYGYDRATGVLVQVYPDLNTNGSGVFTTTIYDNTLRWVAVGKHTTPGASATGYISDVTEAPKVVGRAAESTGTGTITPAVPDHIKGDRLYAFFETKNGETVTMPAGWTQISDSPQNATATRLTVFESDAATGPNSIAAPTTNDPGDHIYCPGIICVRGAHDSGSAIDVTEGNTAATSTSVTVPGDTTTVAHALVLAATSSDIDGTTADPVTASTWANSNLPRFRVIAGGATANGDGGGVSVAAGVKEAAGAYGNSTATLGSTSTQGRISLAIKPKSLTALVVATFNITAYTAPEEVPASGGYRTKGQMIGGLV